MNGHDTAGPARTIPASQFRADCLQLINEVARSGEEIVITKHGVPAARLAPLAGNRKQKASFGAGRHLIHITGDIEVPLDVEWEAEADPDRVLDPRWRTKPAAVDSTTGAQGRGSMCDCVERDANHPVAAESMRPKPTRTSR